MSLRTFLPIILSVVMVLASVVLGCWWQIYTSMQPHVLEPAQAAVVLGASVWPDGRPSPILQSRSLTAVNLYQQGLVTYIATTGGVTADYPSEGSVAAGLASEHGVPQERLIIEGTSTSTWENLSNLLPLLREQGIDDIVIVSDAFHLARAQRMALDLGISKVQICASEPVLSPSRELWYQFRELAALLSYLYLGPTYQGPNFQTAEPR